MLFKIFFFQCSGLPSFLIFSTLGSEWSDFSEPENLIVCVFNFASGICDFLQSCGSWWNEGFFSPGVLHVPPHRFSHICGPSVLWLPNIFLLTTFLTLSLFLKETWYNNIKEKITFHSEKVVIKNKHNPVFYWWAYLVDCLKVPHTHFCLAVCVCVKKWGHLSDAFPLFGFCLMHPL
jgi:hypothetical protein